MSQRHQNIWSAITRFFKTVAANFYPQPDSDDPSSASLLDNDVAVRRFGYLIIIIFFVGGGIWSAVAPMESAASAMGTVQVEGHRKSVQHLEGGIVAEILVSNGDRVVNGEPLLRLDAAAAKAELNRIEGRLWARRARVDRLMSERDDEEVLTFSFELQDVADERASVVMASERALFEARRADRIGEMDVADRRIAQLESEIVGLTAVHAARKAVSISIRTEIDDLNTLLADGYVDTRRIRELERSSTQIMGEILDLESDLAAARVAIEEARLHKLQFTKRFKTSVVESLSETLDQLYDLQQSHAALADRVERTIVRAPTGGVVLAMEPNTIGAVVAPGQELMSIVPDVNQFVIDAKMSPLDIDRIKIGQEAEVRFSIFKDAYTVTGTLINLSADSLNDEVTGEPYYQAKIKLLEEDMKFLRGHTLVPGMPAQVLVKTGTRTFFGYLTSPLRRAFATAMIED